jgi:PilZ domain-containing protein
MNPRERRDPGAKERRAHPRVPCDCALTIQMEDGAHAARLRDISRAGLCFFLDRAVPEMTLLAVRIELPGRAGPAVPIEARGVVVRCLPISRGVEHFEIAVFLSDLADSQRERLDAFVSTAR